MGKYSKFNPGASVTQHRQYWVTRSEECGKSGVRHAFHSPAAADAESELLKAKFTAELQQLHTDGALPARGTALDFGCGWGRWTGMLGDIVGSATGIDISPSYIAGSNATASTQFKLLRDPLAPLPVGSNSIDLLFTCTVLQHLVRDELLAHIVAEFKRVLRPHGVVFIFECMDDAFRDKPHIAFRPFAEYARLFNYAGLAEKWELIIRGERHVLAIGRTGAA